MTEGKHTIQQILQQNDIKQLPEKSKTLYNAEYSKFMEWRKMIDETGATIDEVVLAYLTVMKDKGLGTQTLYQRFSMIKKSCLLAYCNNVTDGSFVRSSKFLKNNSTGYKPKKASTFTREEIEKFLEINDETLDQMKLILVIGIFGGCRSIELTNMTVDDIKVDNEETMSITIQDSKNGPRWFSLPRSDSPWDVYPKYRKLVNMRKDIKTKRLFLNLKMTKKDKQTNTPLGVNTIGSFPMKIAERLKMPKAKSYTGHSYRRTGTTLLAEGGVDAVRLMRFGNWKSIGCAEGYIAESKREKKDIAQIIIGSNKVTNEPNLNQQQLLSPQQEQIQEPKQRQIVMNARQQIIQELSLQESNKIENHDGVTIQKVVIINC